MGFLKGVAARAALAAAPLLLGIVLVTVLAGAEPPGAGAPKGSWDFEKDAAGKIAGGFRGEVGEWAVVDDGGNHVLAQKAENEDATFNVALVESTSAKDIDLSVRLRAVAGEIDQGGGVVWRAK